MDYMLMPLRRYADFSGRSRRMEFWMWKLFLLLVGIGFFVLMMIVGGGAAAMGAMMGDTEAVRGVGAGMLAVMALYALVSLAFLIPDIAVTVRRLHDTDRSGWWILAPLLPYAVGVIAILAGGVGRDAVSTGATVGTIAMLAAAVLGLILLVFMFLEGTRGSNRYGPDPKDVR